MKKAFTLIELMVVISIIGVLAAVTLPRFTHLTTDAKVANVQGNLASLRTSIEMFNVKTEKYPVYGKLQSTSSNSQGETDISSDGNLSEEFTAFYSKSVMPETPASEETSAANQVVDKRDDTGGWLYIETEGQIFANLKNGNYTGVNKSEIWNGETASDNDGDDGDGDNGGVTPPEPNPDPEDKPHSVTGSDLEAFIKSSSWLGGLFSDLEYNEDTEALETTGLLSSGRIKLDSSNTELEEVSKISLKTDSEMEGWELASGPDENGHYTYTQSYDPPKSTAGSGFQVEMDFDTFLGINRGHSVYEITYE